MSSTSIENALEGLSGQLDALSDTSDVLDVEKWNLHKSTSVAVVTQAFTELVGKGITAAIELNKDVASPVREIHTVANVLGQLQHHLANLHRQLDSDS